MLVRQGVGAMIDVTVHVLDYYGTRDTRVVQMVAIPRHGERVILPDHRTTTVHEVKWNIAADGSTTVEVDVV